MAEEPSAGTSSGGGVGSGGVSGGAVHECVKLLLGPLPQSCTSPSRGLPPLSDEDFEFMVDRLLEAAAAAEGGGSRQIVALMLETADDADAELDADKAGSATNAADSSDDDLW